MKRIVVSGATSMIGIALIEKALEDNIEILALVNKNSKNKKRIPNSKLVSIYEVSVEEFEKVCFESVNYDVFYHFAWIGTDKEKRFDEMEQQKNIKYTLDAVLLANSLGCKTFVGAGSQAEYGKVNGIIRPDTNIAPNMAYGISKYSAGRLSAVLCKKMGLKHVWGRIFSVYGPFDNSHTMIMYSIRCLLNGEVPVYTNSDQLWDYLYYKDVGEAFLRLGKFGKNQAVYCVASGISKPLKEYIYEIRDNIAPSATLGIGDLEDSGNGVINLEADVRKLAEDTGFYPRYTFQEGITETIEWVRRNCQ